MTYRMWGVVAFAAILTGTGCEVKSSGADPGDVAGQRTPAPDRAPEPMKEQPTSTPPEAHDKGGPHKGGHRAKEAIGRAVFSPDATLLLTFYAYTEGDPFDEPRSFSLWDVATGKELWQLTRKQLPPGPFAFLPDGKQFLVAGADALALCDVKSGAVARKLDFDVKGVSSLTVLAGGKRLFLENKEDLLLVDWAAGKTVKALKGINRPTAVSADGRLAFSDALLNTRDKKGPLLWAVDSDEVIRDFPLSEGYWGGPFAFASDGKFAVIGKQTVRGPMDDVTSQPQLVLLETRTGKIVQTIDGEYGFATFSADGRFLLSAGVRNGWLWNENQRLKRWEVESGKLLWSVPLDEVTTMVAFSEDGALAVSSAGSIEEYERKSAVRLNLWDAVAGKQLREFSVQARPEK